ncbi:hypothetical protein Daus18300_009070 [Diaporthe australafricana]|uniref:Major facilitator superfamily (MFS) profile domain-containing protein n=1 Tax=Diaporthe australafricana TaxID=127596 RepID=A0ABR3WG52_9PEZI
MEFQPSGMDPDDAAFLAHFSEDQQRKAIRKVDLRLIPMLVLLYLMAYLDKTNIGNAKIEGLLDSLGMTGAQYNVALSIFFIPFVLAEVPSNMVLHLFKRPSLYIGTIVVCWGAVMTLNGVVQTYGGLIAIRFFLGLFEAGFLPGAILVISKWYLPNETQTRIALLYTSAASGGAFSGLLAFGIAKMNGVAGLEGIATVAIGVSCLFWLIDSPSMSARWLNPEEIRFLELRQQARRAIKPSDYKDHHFSKNALFSVLTDWKVYLLIFVNWSNSVPNYAMKFTMPQIIKNMGYTSATAQLLTMPPYAVGAVMYPILPGVNAWNVANYPNPAKRAISIGFLVCVGNIGGLVGSYIYTDKEAPTYATGYGTSFAFASAGIVAAIILEVVLKRLNQKNAKLDAGEVRQRYTDEQLDEMGEKNPLFKYAL